MRKLSLPGVAAAAAALVMASCDSDVNGPQSNDNVTVITASISEAAPASRTAIDPTAYEGGHVGLLWSPGDAIGVYDGATVRNARFANQSQTASGRTTFAGNCSNPQYAYYPYSADNDASEVTAVKGSLAAVQSYDAATRVISGDYKYGTPRTGAPSEFDFKHIFSLLRFNVNATGTDIAGETLKSVSITLPESRVLAGDFTFNILNGAYTFTANTSNKVTVEYAGSPVLTDGATHTAYLSCAPDLHEGDAITVEVLTDKKRASFTAEVAYDFKANAIYTFDLNLSAYADRLTIETLPTEPEEETANCYMITTTGEHDFKATVIGNGEKGIIKGAGFHTENPYISPVEAKLLWEDVQGFITGVTLRDGRVHYTANANVGNALIAVYDAQGTILWSWHIWGVGDTLPEDEEITNYNGAKFMMMDRTLGAHSKTSLLVTLYQWGRKDPVPNSAAYWVNGQEVNIEQSYPVYSGETITVQTGVEHPDELVSIPYVETNRLLWGDNNITDHYTFKWPNYLDSAKVEQTQGWTNDKTIYDPCPVGYRVASKFSWTGFCKNNTGSTPGNSSASSRLDRLNYVKYENGFYFKRNQNDVVGTYYPQVGSRGASTGSLWVGGNAPYSTFNYTASYWSSAPQKNKGYAQCLSIGVYDDGSTSSTVANSHNSVNTLDFGYTENAFAVRCVREK